MEGVIFAISAIAIEGSVWLFLTSSRLSPPRALALATGIAEMWGEVRYFLKAPGLICNFVIYLAGLVAHVRVMRLRYLRCTLTSLEREVGDAFARSG